MHRPGRELRVVGIGTQGRMTNLGLLTVSVLRCPLRRQDVTEPARG